MRILFVAFPNSIHTARWINQITEQGWDIHLAPTDLMPLHPYLEGRVTFHGHVNDYVMAAKRLAVKALRHWPISRGSGHARRLVNRLDSGTSPYGLAQIIRRTRPDIIH